ncbi:MAG: hypothetical protein ACREM2_07840 [Vulcanimicrobiaceae bacterium]
MNAEIRSRLGDEVRTEELSWDSAIWVGSGGTVVAALDSDERTAVLYYDREPKDAIPFRELDPRAAGEAITRRLVSIG